MTAENIHNLLLTIGFVKTKNKRKIKSPCPDFKKYNYYVYQHYLFRISCELNDDNNWSYFFRNNKCSTAMGTINTESIYNELVKRFEVDIRKGKIRKILNGR